MELTALDQFSALFKDYVGHFSNSKLPHYFAFAPNQFDDKFEAFLKTRAREWHESPRSAEVMRCLREQNASLAAQSEKAQQNLSLLAETNTVAIVTGQQVGLLGGPLYTFFKAASAISLANRLSQQYPALNFAPIFWLETEDHDLEEAATTYILDREYGLKTIRYEPSDLPQPITPNAKPWRKQIGTLAIEVDPIANVFQQLRESLAPTEFTDEILRAYEDSYASDTTFAASFKSLLQKLFPTEGLLTFDASQRATKLLGASLFKKELQSSPELSERIIVQSAELEEHYHAQVKPRALNLFFLDQGERFPLVEKEGTPSGSERSFFLQGTKRTLTMTELLGYLENEPECFSPNVVLRPIYQDTLLPTAVYVGGPGEIAYFAQFKSAYEWVGIPMPMILPRETATLIEDRFEKLAEKQGIAIADIILGGREGVRRFLEGLSDPTLAPKFDEANETIDKAIEFLRAPVARTDGSLGDALTTLKGKMLTQVRDFLGKTLAADRKRYANVKAQFEKLLNAVLPHEVLQEREMNLIYFLNKYGWGFWDALKVKMIKYPAKIEEHQLITVGALLPQKIAQSATDARTSDAHPSLVAIPNEEIAS
jgi:bacillithiol biosynthesis cysteine-adding enzyme BshC